MGIISTFSRRNISPNILANQNALTLPGLGFFENLKAGGPSRPAGNISRMGYTKNLKFSMVVATNKKM